MKYDINVPRKHKWAIGFTCAALLFAFLSVLISPAVFVLAISAAAVYCVVITYPTFNEDKDKFVFRRKQE